VPPQISPSGPWGPSILISVVVASRNRPAELRNCLASINQERAADVELIVVDSASSDPSRTAHIARDANARFLSTGVPGAARARNLGLAHARGDIIAFTDDDAVVDFGWLAAFRQVFKDPVIDAVVGPVVVMGTTPPLAMKPGSGIDPAIDRIRHSRTNRRWFDEVAFGSIGFGANLAVRRCTFDRFGTFRECLGAGAPISGDENYFLLKLIANGAIVANEPKARVFHPPQSPARVRELQRSAVAYLLFVMGTQPQLAPRAAVRLLRRILARCAPAAGSSGNGAKKSRMAEILDSLVAAPRLLLEAKRMERMRTVQRASG
jgi:glycosyltransferase involved in cell wall biosynthesis